MHTLNHTKYLYLQLNTSTNNLDVDCLIEKILYYCSINLNLNFKYVLNIPLNDIEKTPIMFFNSANNNSSPCQKYLSYYQAIEFFYIRANNLLLQKNLIHAKIHDLKAVDFKEVNKALKIHKKFLYEKESLKLVIKQSLNIIKFKKWLESDIDKYNYFTHDNKNFPNLIKINMTDNNSIISTISNRIYSIRCSIVHSKKRWI